MLDELDKKTWVLDPNSPSFSSTYRRIVISKVFHAVKVSLPLSLSLLSGSHLSLQVTIDPLNPQLMPECTPLGPSEGSMWCYDSLIELEGKGCN